jgi:uncharacterized HAD superfamily protein
MKTQLKVGWDIDGVLADFGKHFLSHLNLPNHPPTDFYDERFTKNLHRVANDVQFWINIPPIIKPSDITIPIHCYCTARSIPTEVTAYWLWKHNFPTSPIFSVGEGGDKVKILKALGITHFIDDAIHNFIALNEAGIKCFLMTRSHNTHISTNLRVDTIEEFQTKIKYELQTI